MAHETKITVATVIYILKTFIFSCRWSHSHILLFYFDL